MHRVHGMLCAYGNRLGQELDEAREVFDIADTQRHVATFPDWSPQKRTN